MTKQLALVFLTALIALSGVTTYIWMHHNSSSNTRVNTLGEWQTCRNQSKFKICDQIIGTKQQLNDCYQAATDFANLCYPSHLSTTQECANFWQFYNDQQQDAVLPQDYFTCIDQGLIAAKESNFFYKNNYQILWVECSVSAI